MTTEHTPTGDDYIMAVRYFVRDGWPQEAAEAHVHETHPIEVIEAAASEREHASYMRRQYSRNR